ncbi:23072_t:CDS:2, partial [Gigaspora rosea]
KAIMNNTINTIKDMNFLSNEFDFDTNLLNNEPEIVLVENNESKIGLVKNDKSEIDLVENNESEIGLVENDFEYNDENTNKSGGLSSDKDILLIGRNYMLKSYFLHKLKSIRHTYLYQHSSVYKPIKDKAPEKQQNKSSAW